MRRLADITALIENGDLVGAVGGGPSAVIDALRDGFIAAAKSNTSFAECAGAALSAVASLPESALPPRPPAPADGTPITAATQMLREAAKGPLSGLAAKLPLGESNDIDLNRGLAAIERLVGAPPVAARASGSTALGQRHQALRQIVVVDPPVMTAERFCERLLEVVTLLQALARADLRAAA
jgi:hypothetical protein